MNWFDMIFENVPSELGLKLLVVQAFPVFLASEGLRLLMWAFLSIFPVMFSGKKRKLVKQLIDKLSTFLGYLINIYVSFYLAHYRGLTNDVALVLGATSILMHVAWKEFIYKQIKDKLKKEDTDEE